MTTATASITSPTMCAMMTSACVNRSPQMIENVFDSLLSHELREEAVFFMSVIFLLIVVDFDDFAGPASLGR